jgi:hypothetical protein
MSTDPPSSGPTDRPEDAISSRSCDNERSSKEREVMANGSGLMRQILDAGDHALALRVEEFVPGSNVWGDGRSSPPRAVGAEEHDQLPHSRTRALAYLINLPDDADIARLRREIADLDYKIRLLRIDRTSKSRGSAPSDDKPQQSGRTGRPDAPDRPLRAPRVACARREVELNAVRECRLPSPAQSRVHDSTTSERTGAAHDD